MADASYSQASGSGVRARTLRAGDIMARRLITLTPKMDMFTAIDRLLSRKISGAPVVEGGQLVGILSEKDCISALTRSLVERLPFTTVGEAMTREVRSVDVETDLLSIAHLFMTNSFRRLPVLDDGKLVGQISRRDLLKAMAKVLRKGGDYRAAMLYLSAIDGERGTARVG